MSVATGPTVVHVKALVVPGAIARPRLLRLLENAKLASPAPVVMKLQLAGMLAVKDIVPVATSVTVTVFPAMMPHGVEHSSEFCANVKVAARLATGTTASAIPNVVAIREISFTRGMANLYC